MGHILSQQNVEPQTKKTQLTDYIELAVLAIIRECASKAGDKLELLGHKLTPKEEQVLHELEVRGA